jgi:serine protease Do
VQPLTPYIASRLGIEDPRGLVVSRVEAEGPAAAAGLRVGDVIRKVNGQAVATADEAQRVLFGVEVGDSVRLEVDHGSEHRRVTLTFTEYPEKAR